jgi:hypothetical protein
MIMQLELNFKALPTLVLVRATTRESRKISESWGMDCYFECFMGTLKDIVRREQLGQ